MTEEEMKTKWCPHVRMAQPDMRKNYNRSVSDDRYDIVIPSSCLCVGSACSQWRWGQKRNPEWKRQGSIGWPSPHPDDEPPLYIEDREHGFCGLAGRP